MRTSEKNRLTYNIIVGAAIVIFVWIFFQYVKSNYDGYQLGRYIQTFDERNRQLSKKIEGQQSDYDYYRSNTYYEKYAKGNMGLMMPGEKVVIIGEDTTSELALSPSASFEETALYNKSNPARWWMYFFGDSTEVNRFID